MYRLYLTNYIYEQICNLTIKEINNIADINVKYTCSIPVELPKSVIKKKFQFA